MISRYLISVFLLASLLSFSLSAQNFNQDLYFTDVKNAKVMYNDGRVEDNVSVFYHPVILSNPSFNVGDWASYGDPNYSNVTIPKDKLKAIYIDNHTWVERDGSWAAITNWGAIERRVTYNYADSKDIIAEKLGREISEAWGAEYDENDPAYLPIILIQKLDEPPVNGTELKLNFKNIMSEMTQDNAEISTKVANKESGYRMLNTLRVIDEYNEWYDNKYPGDVQIIDNKSWGIADKSDVKKLISNSRERFESKKASRPEVASADIASSKPNVPVKKESFSDKIKRIKADGNKIGVYFTNPYVYIKPPVNQSSAIGSGMGGLAGGMLADNKDVSSHPKDTVVAIQELNSLGATLVERLNAEFNTDIFELVADINLIPYRKTGGFLIDDWWATKYKVLLTYQVDTHYDISKAGEGYSGFFRAITSITTTELFLKKGNPRQKILVSTKMMGTHAKELTPSQGPVKTIAEIESQMNGLIDGENLLQTLLEEREDKLETFIAKIKD